MAQANQTPKNSAADCEMLANYWLAKINEKEEAGDFSKSEEYGRKSQHWLDKANKLRGDA